LPAELGHLAGADEENGLAVEAVEDVPGHHDRGRGHRRGGAAEVRLGPHPLGAPERGGADAGQLAAGGAQPLRLLEGVLHLAEDLGLTEDHRVQAGGHPEEVEHRGLATMGVEVGKQVVPCGASQGRTGPVLEVVAGTDDVELHPVAGGDEQRLGRRLGHGLEQLGLPLVGQREALADVHRRGVVREADADQGGLTGSPTVRTG
jgi:hypothetical protein